MSARACACPSAARRPQPALVSRALGAQLTNGFSGHAAVGHLRLGELVQGTDLVLEGVEEREAPDLGACLARAVAAANACVADVPARPENTPKARAEEIAAQVQPPAARVGSAPLVGRGGRWDA